MSNIEMKFYEMACSFFAKRNKSENTKRVKNVIINGAGKTIEDVDAELNKAMENKNIVDVKVTPMGENLVLYTFIYTEY